MQRERLDGRWVGRCATDRRAFAQVLDVAAAQFFWQLTRKLGDFIPTDTPVTSDHTADNRGQGAHGCRGKAQRGCLGRTHAFQRATDGSCGAESTGETNRKHHAEPVRSIKYRSEQVYTQHNEQTPLRGEHERRIGPHIARTLAHGATQFHGISHGGKHHGDQNGGIAAQVLGKTDDVEHVRAQK